MSKGASKSFRNLFDFEGGDFYEFDEQIAYYQHIVYDYDQCFEARKKEMMMEKNNM